MPDQRLLLLAREARDHAEDVLVRAETFKDEDAKQRTREIAVQYVKVAERLEQAAAD
jgi:hypothetical protein